MTIEQKDLHKKLFYTYLYCINMYLKDEEIKRVLEKNKEEVDQEKILSIKERVNQSNKDTEEKTSDSFIENIFNNIDFSEDNVNSVLNPEEKNNKTFFSPSELSQKDFIEIIEGKNNQDLLVLQKLKNEFVIKLKELLWEEIETKNKIYKLDLLFQNYFTFIPVYKDINLYDYTKLIVTLSNIDEEISLIWWEFEGIQKHIKNWISKYEWLTKRLRARSFTVQMMTEAVLQYTLESLGLTRMNVLIQAGGKFIIVTKRTSEEDIYKINNSINEYTIFEQNIKFNLAQLETTVQEILGDESATIISQIYGAINIEKYKLLDPILWKRFYSNNSEWVLCSTCRQNFITTNKTKCNICEKEEEIGKYLVKEESVYINYKNEEKFYFDIQFKEEKSKYSKIIITFNKWVWIEGDYLTVWKSINNYVPRDGGSVRDIETIIAEDKKSEKNSKWELQGKKMICTLQGDVDNLWYLFRHGFSKEIYSINRIIQLSRYLEIFFWMELKKILEKDFQNIYTVYSGGDDFIFIVPFLEVETFINTLYNSFYIYTGKNKNIHFSLGVGITGYKVPFFRMEEEGKELLEYSKKEIKKKEGVNPETAITLFSKDLISFFTPCGSFTIRNRKDKWLTVLSSTQLYKLFIALKALDNYWEQKLYVEVAVHWARLLNMISKIEEIEKLSSVEYWNLCKEIEYITSYSFDTEWIQEEEKRKRIKTILLDITFEFYRQKYFNN